ncbi:MAG: riboflavin synthase subunit alpha [Legionellales bacterium]|nr:riboflavin synthase subunit alpha [Legionellales bacterium]
MYTGITKGLFEVIEVNQKTARIDYRVQLNNELIIGLKTGDSVSIDGVCQTVVAVEGVSVTFNAIAETLSKTTLGSLFEGRKVSVERSVRIGDENGGHELAGHVVEMGVVVKRLLSENNLSLHLQCSSSILRYIFEKGFIGLDGSSLTVGCIDKENATFAIHLIPETLRVTNFAHKQVGDNINIELDSRAVIITQTLEQHLADIYTRLARLENTKVVD